MRGLTRPKQKEQITSLNLLAIFLMQSMIWLSFWCTLPTHMHFFSPPIPPSPSAQGCSQSTHFPACIHGIASLQMQDLGLVELHYVCMSKLYSYSCKVTSSGKNTKCIDLMKAHFQSGVAIYERCGTINITTSASSFSMDSMSVNRIVSVGV